MSLKWKLNIEYILDQVFFCFIYAIIVNFASAILLERGYSNSLIGVIVAMGSVMTILFQPIATNAVDRKKLTIVNACITMGLLLAALIITLIFFKTASIFVSAIFVIILALYWIIYPLLNSLCFKIQESGEYVSYGIARGLGSLSYSGACAVAGILNQNFGSIALLIAGAISALLMVAAIFITNRSFQKALKEKGIKESDEVSIKKKESSISYAEFISKNRLFVYALLGSVISGLGTGLVNHYMLQIVTGIGGSSADVGFVLSISAFLEVPVMMSFDLINKKFRCIDLVRFASIMTGVKVFCMTIAPSLTWFYVAQIFQLISMPLSMPAILSLTNQVMDEDTAVRGQGLTALVSSFSSILSSLLGGFFLDVLGVKKLLWLAFGINVLGILIYLFFISKMNKDYEDRTGIKTV